MVGSDSHPAEVGQPRAEEAGIGESEGRTADGLAESGSPVMRSGVEDLWHRRDGSPSQLAGTGKRWRARYVDGVGVERTRRFEHRAEAQQWLDTAAAADRSGSRGSQVTVGQWCERWLVGYRVYRDSTVRQARTHIRRIGDAFGERPVSAVHPADVKAWCSTLKSAGYSDSYVYLLHRRLSQILTDAVDEGLIGRNPCSRRTSPPMGRAKLYVATTEQVWALYDAMPGHFGAAVLLGAFAGLRISEAAALRVSDVDFVRGVVHPRRQWPDAPLKTRESEAPIPIARDLTLWLSASVARWPHEHVVTNGCGGPAGPWLIARAIRDVKASGVVDLPPRFTFHDLRHYFASMLIASGMDIKTVQARCRHRSVVTTLETYTHLWPDVDDDATRAAIGAALAQRPLGH